MSLFSRIADAAREGYDDATRVNKHLQKNVHTTLFVKRPGLYRKGDLNIGRQAKSVYGVDGIINAVRNPGAGSILMGAAGLPLFGGEGAAIKKAILEDAVRSGKVAGGAVKITKMSPKEQAARKAKASRPDQHPNWLDDLVDQHKGGSIIMHGDDSIKNAINLAKNESHGNSKFHDAPEHMKKPNGDIKVGTDPWSRGLDPGSMDRLAIVITPQGRMHVGAAGMHHDQVMTAAGIKDGTGHLQAQIKQGQEIYGGDMTPNLFEATNGLDLGGRATKPNPAQHAAIVDFLGKSNGNKYSPLHGTVTPTERKDALNGGWPAIQARKRIAQANRGADDLKIAVARAETPPVARNTMGVKDGGMGRGTGKVQAEYSIATGMNLPKVGPGPKRLDPSTAPKEPKEPRFIPTSAEAKAKRAKTLDDRATAKAKAATAAEKEAARKASLQPPEVRGKPTKPNDGDRMSIAPRKWKDTGTEWTGRGPKPKWLK